MIFQIKYIIKAPKQLWDKTPAKNNCEKSKYECTYIFLSIGIYTIYAKLTKKVCKDFSRKCWYLSNKGLFLVPLCIYKHLCLYILDIIKYIFISFLFLDIFEEKLYQNHDDSSNNSQIMRGVFLHILADTLGSVGVILSALLMHWFGWMIADPICSIFIALLIGLSVLGLIKESVAILMQRQPAALDSLLPQCYQKVMGLAGVYAVQDPHFWTLCSNTYVGAVKLEVSKNIDPKYVVMHARMIFESVGVKQIYIQLDYV